MSEWQLDGYPNHLIIKVAGAGGVDTDGSKESGVMSPMGRGLRRTKECDVPTSSLPPQPTAASNHAGVGGNASPPLTIKRKKEMG